MRDNNNILINTYHVEIPKSISKLMHTKNEIPKKLANNIVCTLPIHFAIDSFIFVKIAINSGDIAYMHCTPLGVNFKFFLFAEWQI